MKLGVQYHAPSVLPLGKKRSTQCTGGWVAPKASLNSCGKSHSHLDLIPRPSSLKGGAIPTLLSQPTLTYKKGDETH